MGCNIHKTLNFKNMANKRNTFFYRNGLSIFVLFLMLGSLLGQFLTGWKEKNSDLAEQNLPRLSISQYSHSGHFIQATFENWESEFLQMTLYVLLTVYLRQKGSSESKKLFEKEDVDREPRVHSDAPWPVKKGGLWLKLYSHSLSIAFAILFILSFILHLYGSLKDHNEERISFHCVHCSSFHMAEGKRLSGIKTGGCAVQRKSMKTA
jgi:hypothetical protein